jgi:hypothetical protein
LVAPRRSHLGIVGPHPDKDTTALSFPKRNPDQEFAFLNRVKYDIKLASRSLCIPGKE